MRMQVASQVVFKLPHLEKLTWSHSSVEKLIYRCSYSYVATRIALYAIIQRTA